MIGQVVSHYKILEKLGEGGMGIVYKAQDQTLNRLVAIKFLPHHLSSNEAEQARFLQEAQAASALNHPNVCVIYELANEKDQPFIVMEYVDGATLRQKLPVKKISDAIAYAILIGEALQEAHSKGIVHRDIKAENIMVNSKNQIKVMDFGLAKLKGSLKLTRTSSTVGTLAYMAPEQIHGDEVDARSDIFSFGVVVFELVAGKLPFRGEHEAAMMYSILNEPPESLLKVQPDAPPELERVINRALERDPEDRYQSAADMVSELRRIQKQSSRISRTSMGEMRVPEPAETGRISSTIASTPSSSKPARLYYFAGALCVLAAAALIGYFSFFAKSQSIDSIAVLPFTNVGADPNTEYLSDGITESLINGLSQISTLTVMSRSSVFHYKGKEIDPQKAGKELGVKAVLTGSVTQRGENLAISTELVDVANNTHIWGDQYNRKLSDILAVQDEISKEISEKLSLKLAGKEEEKMTKRATENTEAYQLYLKGRFYWNKRRADDLKTSMDFFQQAIEKDGRYALAYAGLASAYAIYPEYSGSPAKEYTEKADAAARKAIELDPTLGEPHAVLGLLNVDYFWNWDAAEKEYKRAIELNPNYPTAHHWYSINLSSRGRFDEALAEIKRAQELDPLSLIINENVGDAYNAMRQYDKAEEVFRKTIDLDPNFPGAHFSLGAAYVHQGKFEEGISQILKARELSGSGPGGLFALGYAYGRSGKKEDALKIVAALHEFEKQGRTVAYDLAVVYCGLGDREQALLWLEKAVDVHNSYIRLLKIEPSFDIVRSEPRFAALLKKVGLDK